MLRDELCVKTSASDKPLLSRSRLLYLPLLISHSLFFFVIFCARFRVEKQNLSPGFHESKLKIKKKKKIIISSLGELLAYIQGILLNSNGLIVHEIAYNGYLSMAEALIVFP